MDQCPYVCLWRQMCLCVSVFISWTFLSQSQLWAYRQTQTPQLPPHLHTVRMSIIQLPCWHLLLSLNANINISTPFNRDILTHRQTIALLLYIQILPWLGLWLNSLSLRTADAIVSSLWLPWTEWDLRSSFWLNRLTVALHLWAPTCSGMKLQGNIWLPLPQGLPA